jgi:hypothetical protein
MFFQNPQNDKKNDKTLEFQNSKTINIQNSKQQSNPPPPSPTPPYPPFHMKKRK